MARFLMMNDEFFAAREVTKTDALRLDTFDGGRYGALGTVDENRIRAVRAPARVKDAGTEKWKTPFDLSTIQPEDLAKVDVVYSYTEASATPITALANEGVRGIVTAGHGAGGISTAQQAARTAAIEKGVLFVSATRAGSGAVYDTGAKGIIGAGDLLPAEGKNPAAVGPYLLQGPGADPPVVLYYWNAGLRYEQIGRLSFLERVPRIIP
ncbi:asparaginase domain-containing protein [Paenibacillus rhizoplanae]